MKKINLSIPEPCHENWENMTPADKGRFCAACQKTVVDFTNMNDRQLAEFFKKPVSNMCGRFHLEQLDRDINIPRKRIPWIKYFFQFSLPAFLVSMKASAQGRVKLTGDTIVLSEQVSSNQALKQDTIKKPVSKSAKTSGQTRIKATSIEQPTLVIRTDIPTGMANLKLDNPPMIKNESLCNTLSGRVGGLVIVSGNVQPRRLNKIKTAVKDTAVKIKRIIDATVKKISVYPNPVQRNSNMKIDLKKLDAGTYTVSIISMAGEVIQTEEIIVDAKKQLVDLYLNDVAAGTYFIHVFNRKTAASYSEKIIVE